MATYNTLTRGSTGADLKKLQQSLMDNDYKTDPTRPRVSGALKNAASGELPKAVETAPEANQTHKTTPLPAPTKQEDTPVQKAPIAYDPTTDKAYQSALSKLLQVQKSVPTYKDSFSSQLQDAYNKIVNREKFSYDVNADAMYQQMKDQYVAGGRLAMADTMGQAAALNGGYGSSYAQSVGQQAYQGYMQQLNDVIPELYDRALAQYNQEGQDMYNQYAMLSDMADDEYAKYQDSLNRYYTDLQIAKSDVDTAYNRGYGAYRDSVGDYQWQKTFEYTKAQDKIANDRYEEQIAYERQQAAKSEVLGFVGTDYTPSDSELEAADLTREQYNALSKYATASASGYEFDVNEWIAITDQIADLSLVGKEELEDFLWKLEDERVVDEKFVDATIERYFPEEKQPVVDTTVKPSTKEPFSAYRVYEWSNLNKPYTYSAK